jgi:hypothetical protein
MAISKHHGVGDPAFEALSAEIRELTRLRDAGTLDNVSYSKEVARLTRAYDRSARLSRVTGLARGWRR